MLKNGATPLDKFDRTSVVLVVAEIRAEFLVSRKGMSDDGKVVGVENAQMGWFNANLGARRTRHRGAVGLTLIPCITILTLAPSSPPLPSFKRNSTSLSCLAGKLAAWLARSSAIRVAMRREEDKRGLQLVETT